MLSANSPNTKYFAGLSALLTVVFSLSVLPADRGAMTLFLAGTAIAYTAMFYFLARTVTRGIAPVSRRRNALGFLLAGGAVLIWMYATFVFGIDLTRPNLTSRTLLALMFTGLIVGLADIGWTTGRLAESLAIKRARGKA